MSVNKYFFFRGRPGGGDWADPLCFCFSMLSKVDITSALNLELLTKLHICTMIKISNKNCVSTFDKISRRWKYVHCLKTPATPILRKRCTSCAVRGCKKRPLNRYQETKTTHTLGPERLRLGTQWRNQLYFLPKKSDDFKLGQSNQKTKPSEVLLKFTVLSSFYDWL